MPITFSKDHYATLGVSPGASEAEIKRAYRVIAKKIHPDINANEEAQARFSEITHAYAVVSDPWKRVEYDRQRQVKTAPSMRRSYRHYDDRDRDQALQMRSSASVQLGSAIGVFGLTPLGHLLYQVATLTDHQLTQFIATPEGISEAALSVVCLALAYHLTGMGDRGSHPSRGR